MGTIQDRILENRKHEETLDRIKDKIEHIMLLDILARNATLKIEKIFSYRHPCLEIKVNRRKSFTVTIDQRDKSIFVIAEQKRTTKLLIRAMKKLKRRMTLMSGETYYATMENEENVFELFEEMYLR